MKSIKTIVVLAFIAVVMSCNNEQKKVENTEERTEQQSTAIDFSGNYVTADYINRNEGYDWVAVIATKSSDSTLLISIRSRADKKKPTCTFDADASRVANNVFKSTINGKNILYTFKDGAVAISTEKKEEEGILNFYCSGGGSLAGIYKKISEPLDTVQIDHTVGSH